VVQEAFQRLSKSDFDAIEDARGWLIVVTSRLCLDVVRSARHRHEQPVGGPDMAERFDEARPGGVDPADRVTLDDGVRLALLVVLERLSPAERVAFVLHDIFGVPFDAVAETVGRPEATCRQLARRARLKLDSSDGARRATVTPDEHRLVTDRFIAACASGSFEGLLAVLDPDVTGGVDLFPGLLVRGARFVASNLLRYWESATLVSLPFVDNPCLLGFVDRDVACLISLTVEAERVAEIHVYCEPRALDFLREHVLP
jgi:RNA polymerase sigma-70 factor (ECF subfamily)